MKIYWIYYEKILCSEMIMVKYMLSRFGMDTLDQSSNYMQKVLRAMFQA